MLDTSLRYTVDKTSREVLFLPLPAELKYRAKPFIDVTMDRFAKGMGALLILVLIKDWGFGFDWQQLSYASLTMVGLWVITAIAARREYLRSFRRSIEEQVVEPSTLRLNDPDPSSVETLVSELAHPEPRRVLYAIDLLDAMDKRHLVTPLLLSHDSPAIRARALGVAEAAGTGAGRSLAAGRRARAQGSGQRRAHRRRVGAGRRCAASAAADVMRPFVAKSDPALAIVAAAALAGSAKRRRRRDRRGDAAAILERRRASRAREWRLQVARALGDVKNPAFRPLLVPLMYDANLDVARAAIESAGTLGARRFPVRAAAGLAAAQSAVEGGGAGGAGRLRRAGGRAARLFHARPRRRHLDSPPRAVDAGAAAVPGIDRRRCTAALDDADGFLRFKATMALQRMRQRQSGAGDRSEGRDAAHQRRSRRAPSAR